MTDEKVPQTAEVVRDDQKGGKRLYRVRWDGSADVSDYWSVTTLIDGGIPKKALVYWAAGGVADTFLTDPQYWVDEVERWGDEEVKKRLTGSIWQRSGKKADVGTEVHKAIESYVKGADADEARGGLSALGAPYFAQFLRFVEHYDPQWEASELTVVHTQHGWAGTLDAIINLANGRRLVVDYKTTKAQKDGKPGIYLETAIQCAMYRHAEYAIDQGTGSVFPMPETDGAACLWLAPDRYELIELEASREMYRLGRLAAEVCVALDKPRDFYMKGRLAA